MEDNEKQTNKQTYKYKTNHLNTYYSVVQQLCSMGGGGHGDQYALAQWDSETK